ncbi:hypothetical protein FS749_003680 [Ceratobasidium sp. UAMH 11750]|nr:hypothetical protein FS749_003680 [Ceratobasidium sp. UAMH 11750]
MPGLHSEYRELFRLQTFQRGRPTAFALSPTGRWICSASDHGDLLVQRSTRGYIYCHVGMGRLSHVTAITWATDLQIILGCFNGAVYVATLTLNPNENRIKITHLLDDVVSPVRALTYDIDCKLLAPGYRSHVSVWHRSVGETHARPWKMVDIFRTTIGDLPAKVNTLCFFGPHKYLFLGLDAGAMIWFASGQLTILDTGTRPYRIGSAALSGDESTMAISTLDQSVIIWPVSPEGPFVSLANEYALESGREWHRFEPCTPVAFTSDLKVACGTLDGMVVILSHTGSCLQKIKNRV